MILLQKPKSLIPHNPNGHLTTVSTHKIRLYSRVKRGDDLGEFERSLAQGKPRGLLKLATFRLVRAHVIGALFA